MRNFNNTVQKQASAMLQQGGASDEDVKRLIPMVATIYREQNDVTVKGAVQQVLEAETGPASAAVEANGAPDASDTAADTKATKKQQSAKKAPAKKTAKASKASKPSGTPAQKEEGSKARAPRRTVKEQMILAATENDWKVTEHKLGSKAEQDIKMLNPRRGARDWAATFTKGKATLHVSTLRNKITSAQHADGCWLYQDGKTRLVEYVYEIIGTISTPLTKDGFAVVPPKDEGRKRVKELLEVTG